MKKIFLLFTSLISLYAINCATMDAIKKYNGHYYTITSHRMTFNAAKAFAEANGGYLAIPNSAAENEFLRKLIPTPKYAWIGVYDPQYTSNYCYGGNCLYDDSRFRDIKGNALTYTNWASVQPDNLVKEYDILDDGKQLVSPLGEHWVAISSLDGKWADFGNHADEYNNPVKFYALIEFEDMPECYEAPSNVSDTIEGAKCNTQIYDNSVGILSQGETHNCLKDPNGVYYCPVALAPCADAWDYRDGYSVERTRIVEKEYDTIILKVGYSYSGWQKKLFIYDGNFRLSDTNKVKKFILKKVYNDDYTMVVLNGTRLGTFGYSGNTLKVVGSGNDKKIQINENPDKFIYNWFGDWRWFYVNKNVKPYLINGTNELKVYNVIGKEGAAWAVFDVIADKDVVVCNNSQYCTIKKTGTVTVQVEETYYEYLCSGTNYYGESYQPVVETGDSPTPPPNNCKAKSYRCKPAPNRKCVKVDNKWQCSPFPCIGEGEGDYNITNLDTPVGINDANDDGWEKNGNCLGQIYIFNGKDMRCRSKDAIFNLGLLGGGCCNKDSVFFGLIECKESEKMLARKRRKDLCHYIGEYCSKKFLGVCLQKKRTYCCFNSKLARIINEQGRVQLNKGWGWAKSPNCRGFTPEEFTKLDFSKMDLSEFFDELNKNISSNVLNNMTNYIQNNIQMQLQNIAPNP